MLFRSRNNLSSLPAELHLTIVGHLPRTSLAIICRLNRHWRWVGTDEFMRRLLPITDGDDFSDPGDFPDPDDWDWCTGHERLMQLIGHYIDSNDADARQRLLDFKPTHPYFPRKTMYHLPAELASLRARVTKDEEKWFCMRSD